MDNQPDKDEVIDVMGAWLAARLSIIDRKRQLPFVSEKAARINRQHIEEHQQIRLAAEQRLVALGLGSGEDPL